MNRKQLLIVDDEEAMRHMLKSMLSKEGYETKTASSGQEALRFLGEELFDLVLCDIKMPSMDGLTFLNEAKKTGFQSPVIMMSAYGSIDTAIKAIKEGAYDYISKPFNRDEIILTIKKA